MDATEIVGVSVDGTGQIGTYFYTAPEIEQGWPKINEKVNFKFIQTYILQYLLRRWPTCPHPITPCYRLTCTA